MGWLSKKLMDHYDLIIIGAGPAGLTLAKELADSSFKILLLDKKKNAEDVRYNTSGSFIDPKVWNLPETILNPIYTCYFSSKNVVVAKQTKEHFTYIINRKKLLAFLENQAKENKNLKIEYQATTKLARFDDNKINHLIYTKAGKDTKVSAKVYADCSGVSAILGNQAKITPQPLICLGIEYLVPLTNEPHTIDLLVGSNLPGGYGWVFPKDEKTAIVGYGTFFREYFPKIENFLKDMWKIKRISQRCKLKPLEKNIAAFRTGKPLKEFTKGNLLIIGDSAIQGNPLVGEGIRFVMDASKMAAKWVAKSLNADNLKLLKNYDKDWHQKYFRKYQLAFKIQQKLKEISTDDKKLDFCVKSLEKLSNYDFTKLLSADLSYSFLLKLAVKNLQPKTIKTLLTLAIRAR